MSRCCLIFVKEIKIEDSHEMKVQTLSLGKIRKTLASRNLSFGNPVIMNLNFQLAIIMFGFNKNS